MRATVVAGMLFMAGLALTASGPALSASCSTFESVGGVGLANACSGTSANAALSFRPTDPAPVFVFGGGFEGSGDFSSSIVTPGFVQASALAYGSGGSDVSIDGTAPGGSGSTRVSARLDSGTLRLFGSLAADDERFPASDSFSAAARFADILTLTIPKSLVAPTVTLSLVIDGSILGSTAAGAGVVQAGLQAGSIDGSVNYPGAAYLSCAAAGRVGAGLVTGAIPEPVWATVATKLAEPTWLPLDLIIRLHDRQIELHGGLAGTRDHGLLESAIARPLNAW